jgi:hypothetical protein
MVMIQLLSPLFSCGHVHLPTVRLAYDHREIAGGGSGLFAGQLIKLKLKVLRHQLTDENFAAEQCRGEHTPTEKGREFAGAFHDAPGVIHRHRAVSRFRSCGLSRLFNIDEA